MSNNELFALLGKTIQAPEIDYDDDTVQSETGNPVEEEGLMLFYFTSITDHIGESDFKENFMSVIEDVQKYSVKQQQMLGKEILNKINEIYDFDFPVNVDYNTLTELNEIYNFLKFIEFDNEQFLLSIWKYLDIGLAECFVNEDKIINEIEENLKSNFYPQLIYDFLRTNKKVSMIEWFCKNSQKIRSSILIQKGTK